MKKWLIRILGTLLALVVIGLLVIGGLVCDLFIYWETSRDIPPSDLSALTPHRVNIPDAQNGFLLLEHLDLKFTPDEEAICNTAFSNDPKTQNWNQAKVDSLLAKYHDAIATFDRAMALPEFQVPEVKSLGQATPYLSGWNKLTALKMLESEERFHKSDRAAAFHDALQIIDFGQRVEKGDGVAMHYTMGIATASIGRGKLERFINASTANDRAILEECNREAAKPFDEVSASQEALRNDFQAVLGTFRADPNLLILRANEHYKPNRTYQEIAQSYESLIQLAPMTFEQMQPHLPVERTGLSEWFWKQTVWMSSNAVGEIFYKIAAPSPTTLTTKCFAQTNRALLQTMIALRLYALDHDGALPDSLTAIAPHYLPSIPLDDYDGKLIRYSKAHRVIYSVGEKLTDNGDVFSPNAKNSSETPHIDLKWK